MTNIDAILFWCIIPIRKGPTSWQWLMDKAEKFGVKILRGNEISAKNLHLKKSQGSYAGQKQH